MPFTFYHSITESWMYHGGSRRFWCFRAIIVMDCTLLHSLAICLLVQTHRGRSAQRLAYFLPDQVLRQWANRKQKNNQLIESQKTKNVPLYFQFEVCKSVKKVLQNDLYCDRQSQYTCYTDVKLNPTNSIYIVFYPVYGQKTCPLC